MSGGGILYLKDGMEYARHAMVRELRQKGVTAERVLAAMARVPRHRFVSEALGFSAYRDHTLPIGHGQTASKPSVVGRMIQALYLQGRERVLEVGTGSGYQTALLSELASQVVSVERIKELSLRAREILIRLDCRNVRVLHTENFLAMDECFDAVVVSAGAEEMPQGIFSMISPGGVLVIPLSAGGGHVIRRYVKRSDTEIIEEELCRATFVPLVCASGERCPRGS